MVCLKEYGTRIDKDGKKYVNVAIQADDVPTSMPKTGAEVEGMEDDELIDVASILMILNTSKSYVMGEDFNWYVSSSCCSRYRRF